MGAARWATVMLPALIAAGAASAKETLSIRGQPQTLHVYGNRGGPVAIVASGDGGWIHLGPYVAEFLAGQGYYVVGLDSKAYLSSFTRDGTTLGVSDVPGDFATLLDYAARGATLRPLLVGVSEGAGLAVLAAGDDAVKARALGVVALGLPDKNELGWRFRDSVIYLTKGVPKEPLFSAADVIGKVSPLPVAAIHSTRDEFVPVEEVQRVMARAGEPKQLVLVEAADHAFGGHEAELDRRLLEAIEWIKHPGR
jgi:alpha-beta hydrolase superfamily lysophospholipase